MTDERCPFHGCLASASKNEKCSICSGYWTKNGAKFMTLEDEKRQERQLWRILLVVILVFVIIIIIIFMAGYLSM